MEIQKGSDVVILLKLTDIEGLPMRVNDCSQFKIKVWTQNPNNHLVYHKRDIICGEMPPMDKPHTPKPRKKPANHLEIPPMPPVGLDRLPISAHDLACLESGILVYSYSYAKPNSDFSATDNYYDKVKVVVTDIYYRNTNLHEEPSNPVNFLTIEHLKDLIEEERQVRDHDIEAIRNYVEEEYTNKLEDEIRRSTDVDIAFHNLIKENHTECQNTNTAISERVDALEAVVNGNNSTVTDTINQTATGLASEIARSTAKDIEHDTAIATETTRARGEETRIEGKVDTEIARAKAAEQTFYDLVDTERSRAKAAEEILTTSVSAETTRATAAENALSQLIQANTEAINAEKQRSNDKDTEHTNAVNSEIARAKAEEARIENITTDNANDIATETARAKQVESDITTQLSTLKDSYLATQAKVIANETAISVLNGDETTVGSVAHAQADANHYTDDKIAALKSEMNNDTQTTLANYATKAEVSTAIQNVIGTAPEALDTLGEIADALNNDSDAITAINGVLSGKANSSDVYTKTEVDTKETAINNSISTVQTNLSNEVARATAAESVIDGKVAANATAIGEETTRAKGVESGLQTDVAALQTSVGNLTTSVNTNTQEIGEIKADISGIKSDAADTKTDLAAEVTRATNAESVITSNVATNASNIATEAARAKQVESDITSSLQTLKTSVNEKNTATDTALSTLQTDLANEITRATNAERTNAEAIAVITGDINTVGSIKKAQADAEYNATTEATRKVAALQSEIENTLKDYATKEDVDARIEGIIGTAPEALDTLGEIAEELGKDNDAITAINSVLTGKADKADTYTKAEIDSKTTALSNDLSTEVTRATAAETTIAANLTDEITRAKAEEARIEAAATAAATDLAAEITRAKAAEKAVDDKVVAEIDRNVAKDNELNTAIANEVARSTAADNQIASDLATETTRATAAETLINEQLAVINGEADVIGSIKHCLSDSKHYTDDKVEQVADRIPTKVSQLTNDLGYLTEHQSLADYYNKAQVDELIENVDVTDQLAEYAKIAETTVIKDNNDKVIVEMIIDNGDEDDTIEVYTKAQCDAKFAPIGSTGTTANADTYTKAEVDEMVENKVEKVAGKGLSTNDYTATDKAKVANIPNFWNGTKAQYDAIADKDNNTIYFIYE